MAADGRSSAALSPEAALAQGHWVKLICGASNQDLPAITDLCTVFGAAGVHCIDVAADPAVVEAARAGFDWLSRKGLSTPWLMVSLSDGRDVHFRKAWFDASKCPLDCPRPCQTVCPADAIRAVGAVDAQRCYGCGRCLPACPQGLIEDHDHQVSLADVSGLIAELCPDAVEIHTAPGRLEAFMDVVGALATADVPLRRLAVSCGLEGHGWTTRQLSQELWQRYRSLRRFGFRPLWQLDGRPMSGDVGAGTARSAVQLWRAMRPLAPPGPLQLAGGTNASTLDHLSPGERPAGIAFGGVARRLLMPLLDEAQLRGVPLRAWPEGWAAAVQQARALIQPWLDRPSSPLNC